MADLISQLPTDQTPLNHDEIFVLQTLFKEENRKDISRIFIELKDAVLGGILFAILSLPQVNQLLARFVPSTQKSPLILIGLKTIIFISLYWIILNFALAKKSPHY